MGHFMYTLCYYFNNPSERPQITPSLGWKMVHFLYDFGLFYATRKAIIPNCPCIHYAYVIPYANLEFIEENTIFEVFPCVPAQYLLINIKP